MSSVFVYPDSEQNFEYTLPNPITLYGKLRLEQESLLEKSCFPYTILRISNIYGHQHLWETKFDNVIDKFISNALSKKDLTLYGDGKQLVDLLHIKYFINILLDQIHIHINLLRNYLVNLKIISLQLL